MRCPSAFATLLFVLAVGCGSDDEVADFTLVAPPGTIELPLGQVVDISVTVERHGDLPGSIIVTASGLRAGITAGTARFPAGQTTAVLPLNIETSVFLGPLDDAELVGVAGDIEHAVPIDLIVVE